MYTNFLSKTKKEQNKNLHNYFPYAHFGHYIPRSPSFIFPPLSSSSEQPKKKNKN